MSSGTNQERIEQNNLKLAQLKNKADNLPEAGGGSLNVYVQESEPTNKDGIWLQTNKIFNKTYFDEQVKRITVEGWDTATEYPTFSLNNYFRNSSIMIGDYFYAFSTSSYSDKYAYKCNWKTGEVIQIATLPATFSESNFYCITSVGTDIYLICKQFLYKYDTITDTYTKLVSIASNHNYGEGTRICSVGTDIYLFGGSFKEKNLSKYDTLTNNLKLISSTIPIYVGSDNQNGCLSVIGNKIYCIGCRINNSSSSIYTYVYDTLSNTFTELQNTPFNTSGNINAIFINNYIYIFGGGNYTDVYKYDVINNTYEKKASASITINSRSSLGVVNDNKIIVFTPNNKVLGYALTYDAVYDYEDNSVIVWDGFGRYKTQMTSPINNQEGKIKTLFYNVYYYTTSDGLDDTIPTYYGDGTQWIKFKN